MPHPRYNMTAGDEMAASTREKLIIAHRGAHRQAPENTLAACEAAIACGTDMIELDIRKTGDGFFIAHHDPSVSGRVINRACWKDLRALGRQAGKEIPLLEDILRLTGGRIQLNLEIKEPGGEPQLLALARKYFHRSDFVFTSFSEIPLRRIKNLDSGVRVGLIIGEQGFRHPIRTRILDLFPFKKCRESGIDIIIAHWKLLRLGFVRRAGIYRFPLWVWTVNDSRRIQRLLDDDRISGIITDEPELAVRMTGRI